MNRLELHPLAATLQAANPWNQHDRFDRAEWINDVSAGNTNCGYWDWLSACLEAEDAENSAIAE